MQRRAIILESNISEFAAKWERDLKLFVLTRDSNKTFPKEKHIQHPKNSPYPTYCNNSAETVHLFETVSITHLDLVTDMCVFIND